MKEFFGRMDLTRRLIVINIALALGGSVLFAIAGFVIARSLLFAEVESKLAAVRDLQIQSVEAMVDRSHDELTALATNEESVSTMRSLNRAFGELRDTPSESAARLRQLYITENRRSSLQDLDNAGDGSDYSVVHNRIHSYYRKYINDFNYYDFFYLEPEKGYIIYSVTKEDDFGTNMVDGPHKDSGIAEAFRGAMSRANETDGNRVYTTDWAPYGPSAGAPAAFQGTVVRDRNRVIGVVILQYTLDDINAVMDGATSLGETGDAYLIGADNGLIRTTSPLLAKESPPVDSFMNPDFRVDSDAFRQAVTGETGVTETKNYRGDRVLTAYAPLEFSGHDWVILTEMRQSEALESLDALMIGIGIITIIVVSVISVFTFLVARAIMNPLSNVVNVLSTSTREIAATVDQQERTANQQSASVNQTTTTMSELAASSTQTADQSETVATGAREALNVAQEGGELVQNTLNGIQELRAKVGEIAQQISHLSEQTHQIGTITNFVGDLATQTNMLALNAAVEAVRAGEHGKGFAVVASEIRKLADQSKKSAERIHGLVLDIQKATDSTVMATDEGMKTVEEGSEMARRTAFAFDGVTQSLNTVFENTQQISLNVKQQSIAVNEVLQAMNSINSGARESAAGTAQTKEGVHQLNQAAASLRNLMRGRGVTDE